MPSTTKLMPMIQCAQRSTSVKRTICRPVGLSCVLIGPSVK